MRSESDSRAILWDFDQTLAFRPHQWRGLLVEILDEHEPGHGVDVEVVRPYVRDGFPWHSPDRSHLELCTPSAWWDVVEGRLASAYRAAGFGAARSAELARSAHLRYVDYQVGWRLFDDTIPVLTTLRARGWRHVILSNHVPELKDIAFGLGLDALVDDVISSAVTGYEKPHPEAFACGQRAVEGVTQLWMVGDNFEADVRGAEAVGIPAILARRTNEGATRVAPTLQAVMALLGER